MSAMMGNASGESMTRDFVKRQKQMRRRNLLALVLDFLRSEGLVETASALASEAPSSVFYQLCDNVCLDTMLQDYEAYYQLRYHRTPQIAKKTEAPPQPPPHKPKPRPKSSAGTASSREKSRDGGVGEQESKQFTLQGYEIGKSQNKDAVNYGDCDAGMPKKLKTPEVMSDEHRELVSVISCDFQDRSCDVSFDDIVGLDVPKRIIRETLVHPRRFPQLYTGLAAPWRTLLLFGPAGNGKTMLARAVASECDQSFFNVSVSSLVSKWRGESEKLVRMLFELARCNAPSTVFIDEVDSLLGHRDSTSEHEASRRLKTELLRQLDRLQESTEPVLLIAATNLPWDLDVSLLRRMEKRVYVDLPSADQRRVVLQQLLADRPSAEQLSWSQLVQETDGYSCSDIRVACREAVMASLRRAVGQSRGTHGDGPKPEPLTTQIVSDAIERCRPSAKYKRSEYVSWASNNSAN